MANIPENTTDPILRPVTRLETTTKVFGGEYIPGDEDQRGISNLQAIELAERDQYIISRVGQAKVDPSGDIPGEPGIAPLDTSGKLPKSNNTANVVYTGDTQTLTNKTYVLGGANKVCITNSSNQMTLSTVSDTELKHLSGVTSNVQTQLNGKQATITGAASTITSSNLTASKVLVSDANGKVTAGSVDAANVVGTGATQTLTNKTITLSTANRALITNGSKNIAESSVTSTELGYVSGVTSSIQTQLNTASGKISDLIYDTFTVAGGGYGLTYTCYVAKRNGIVTLQAYGSALTSSIPGMTTVTSSGSLPAAYRPLLNTMFVGFNSTGTTDLNYSVTVTADGKLVLYSGSGGWGSTWASAPTLHSITYVAKTV